MKAVARKTEANSWWDENINHTGFIYSAWKKAKNQV
jgi:hypothetical protein